MREVNSLCLRASIWAEEEVVCEHVRMRAEHTVFAENSNSSETSKHCFGRTTSVVI